MKNNNMKFIYVMDDASRDMLIDKGFALLKEDAKNGIWVFANKDITCFDLDIGCPHVLSDVMTF